MEELKPCPFCGGTDLRLESFSGWGIDIIVCYDCLATFSHQEITCEEDLIKAWNRRVMMGEFMGQTVAEHEQDEKFLTHILMEIREYAKSHGQVPDETLKTIAEWILGLLQIATFNDKKEE